MDLVHQAGPEQGVIQFPAAFAEQAFHSPFLPKPAQGEAEV
jgi:hypothetical protein